MEALAEILQKLNDAYTVLRTMTLRAKTAEDAAHKIVAEAKEMKAALDEQLSLVAGREKAVAILKKEILSSEEVATAKNAIEQAKATLENDRKAFNRQCSERKAVLDQGEADLKDKQTAYMVQLKDLEAEKASYKAKILENITKGASK